MSEDFLKYYNRELAYLRHKGQEFGEQYPKIAARLRMNEEVVEDPHVSRLLEGCAFLSARIRQSLDNAFPQLTEALIGQLFPDFHAPIPSMSMVQLKGTTSTSSTLTVKKGERVTITAPGYQECDFITCCDTQVHPFDVTDVRFENAPFSGTECRSELDAKSVLKIEIQSHNAELSLATLDDASLRFYLNGQRQVALQLYQLLFQSCIGMSLVQGGRCKKELTPRHLRSLGFDDEIQAVPYSKRSFSGTRLLIEYLHFPEKFLFFELTELDFSLLHKEQGKAEIWIYFAQSNDWLEKQVSSDNLALGTVPVVNLYQARVKPMRVQASEYEYQLHPEHSDPESSEVVSIDNVTLRNWNKVFDNLPPYYAGTHTHYQTQHDLFWVMRREDRNWAGGFDEPGREVFVSLVDRKHQLFAPDARESWLMSIDTWCCNRNLPSKIPFGGGLPLVSLPESQDNFSQVRCLTTPTETIRAEMDDTTRWQFAKLITLDHFCQQQGATTLKQLLNLLAFRGSPETKALIDAIKGLSTQMTTGRVVQNGRVGFCHGSEITLTISDQILSREQIFLLGSVLSSYFSHFAEINTFTRLLIKLSSTGELFHKWPSMAGERELL